MAVQVFQRNPDGSVRSEFIDPSDLQNHLDAGWSVDDPDADTFPGVTILNPKAPGEPLVNLSPVETVSTFPIEPVNVPTDTELLDPPVDIPLAVNTLAEPIPATLKRKRKRGHA